MDDHNISTDTNDNDEDDHEKGELLPVDEDDPQEIEQLALTADLDSDFLDCWEDEAVTTDTATTTHHNHHHHTGSNTATSSSLSGDSKLPSTQTSASSSLAHSPHHPQQQQQQQHALPRSSQLSSSRVAGSADLTWDEFDKASQSLMENFANTLAAGSSSSAAASALPPFETTTTGAATAAATAVLGLLQHQQNQQQQQQPPPNAMAHPPMQQQQQQQQQALLNTTVPSAMGPLDSAALLPLAFNALAAGVDLTSYLSSASIGAAAAAVNNQQPPHTTTATTTAPGTTNGVMPPGYHHTSPQVMLPNTDQVAPAVPNVLSSNPSIVAAPQQQVVNPTNPSNNNNRRKSGGGRRTKKSKAANGGNGRPKKNEEPPFMLFDAPVELRHNFAQSQRLHGIPELRDNNSYHYERSSAVTGANGTAITTTSNTSSTMPRLADARHGDATSGTKRIKNAKEQKRAQRITELIDQLRVRMEKGGWKVGIKSKLHTLSSCSDYVKHLVKATKEKEALVEQARNELEAKKQKLEFDKSNNQDPSEPESTTSSLTVSSGSRSANKKDPPKNVLGGSSGDDGGNSSSGNQSSHDNSSDKNDSSGTDNKEISSPSSPSKGHSDIPTEGSEESSSDKKRKLSSHESNSDEYPSSVENEDSGGGKKHRNGHVSVGPISSVSDITDNNKYHSKSSSSSDDTNGTMTATANGKAESKPSGNAANPSAQSTVCSDAAVAEMSAPKDTSHDGSSGRAEDGKNDMNIQTITTTTHLHRKRKLIEKSAKGRKSARNSTSLEKNFRLDYEEVFLKSNVPQIIASTTGQIVVFNEIFLRATTLRRSHVERLTIFSLVQTSMLSNLFELVASSLKDDEQQNPPSTTAGDSIGTGKKTATPLTDYSTMTLPCVPFKADRPPLFMTITLMSDKDVKKRCFHCIFTDCEPAVKGAVGSVTPQLLATLFQPVSSSSDSRSSGHSSPASSADGDTTSDKEPRTGNETISGRTSASAVRNKSSEGGKPLHH